MITDLDKEIASAQALLNRLLEARKAAVAARDAVSGGSRRASGAPAAAPSVSLRIEPAESATIIDAGPYINNSVAYEPIEDTLCRVMADGRDWSVSDAHQAVVLTGRRVTKPTINSALNRGSRPGGLFERIGHGVYRVRATQEGIAAAK